jgi:uncharacterized protein YbcI
MNSTTGTAGTSNSSANREISRGLISIYKDHTDRGPSAARTTISEHHAVTMLESSLTKAERTLVQRGDGDLVRELRRKFQAVMSDEVCRLVARATGRATITLLSDHDVVRDLAVEVVVFEAAVSPEIAATDGKGPTPGDVNPGPSAPADA